jgi:hypothetical protein
VGGPIRRYRSYHGRRRRVLDSTVTLRCGTPHRVRCRTVHFTLSFTSCALYPLVCKALLYLMIHLIRNIYVYRSCTQTNFLRNIVW